MNNAVQRIIELGIVPVVHVKQAAWAEPLAQALIEGGLPAIEVLVRSEGALDILHTMKQNHPEMTVGAGTVMTVEQAQAAVKAGADFIVSPGYDQTMIDACSSWGIIWANWTACSAWARAMRCMPSSARISRRRSTARLARRRSASCFRRT